MRSDPLFSDDAAALIHDAARGLPRAINNLATQALIAAWAGRKNIVDEQSARAAVTEITTVRACRYFPLRCIEGQKGTKQGVSRSTCR